MLVTGFGFVAHAADPGKKFEYPQNLGSNSQAARDAYAKAQAHGEAVIAAREKRAGRPLAFHEQCHGLDREPMSYHERIRHEAFKPKLSTAPQSQMERVADSLSTDKESALAKAYKLSGPARWEALARASAGVDDDAIEQAALRAAHLETPAVAAALKEVDAIRKNMLWDPSRTAAELAALDRVEAQWREPNGDRSEAAKMLALVRVQELQRHTDAVAAQSAAIAAQQQALGELIASAPPVESSNEN